MFRTFFGRAAAGGQQGDPAPEALRGAFDAELDRLQATALEAQAEGSPSWDALLNEYGLEPGTRDERLALAQGGFCQRCGAPLAEVKQALQALEASTLERWWDLGPGGAREEVRQHVMRRVRETGDAYVAQVKPQIQMSNVFANALLSSQQHLSKMGPAKHVTVRCRNCGSPRAQDDETVCRYCGHSLYEAGAGA